MVAFRFIENAGVPRLAWCAEIVRSSSIVTVEHGSWVETRAGRFVEGVWNASFAGDDLGAAEVVLGSGGTLRGGVVEFTPTTHTMERLYSLRLDQRLYISNSLPYLLEATDSELDVKDWSYESMLMTFLRGYKRAASALRIAGGRTLRLHYHRTVTVDKELRIGNSAPPAPPAFATFGHYTGYLRATLEQLHANATDPARRVHYEPLTTISSGYDSAACAVLAKHIGCRRSVTFKAARQAFEAPLKSIDDSGEDIARFLDLSVDTYCRDAYLSSRDFPEVPFIATGNGGDDVVLSALESRLEGCLLITGMLGDTLWSIAGQDPELSKEYRFRFPAGGSLQEYRLSVGFAHAPIPLFTFTRHAEIQAISRSEEMAPWRLGIPYDRPIPRRLIEQAGVPRDAFAREKKAITQPFWLQRATARCMSAASLDDFHDFVARCARRYPLGVRQIRAKAAAREAYYKLRKRMRRLTPVDPCYSPAYEAAAVAEPLRFHWAVQRRRAVYKATVLSGARSRADGAGR